jgi:hypothetical protein
MAAAVYISRLRLTIFDLFEVVGFFIMRDKKERYWEGHERIVPM